MADQGAEGLLSPFLRRKRFEAVLTHINGRVLDIGCGSGKLALYFSADNYVGVDIDLTSLLYAHKAFPNHVFQDHLPDISEKFDSVISLAVIEHVNDPCSFLQSLRNYLTPSGRIIVTTPHPSFEFAHNIGSSLGLFSRHANEEHEKLLNKSSLMEVSRCANLNMSYYKRFLFGVNQLAIFTL